MGWQGVGGIDGQGCDNEVVLKDRGVHAGREGRRAEETIDRHGKFNRASEFQDPEGWKYGWRQGHEESELHNGR